MGVLIKHKHRVILIFILVVLIIKAYYSEKILVNDGLGFDGAVLGDFTKNIIPHLKNHFIDKYRIQRIGVPVFLHYIFSFFNIAYSNSNIIQAFSFLNISCILIGAIYFFVITTKLKLTPSEEIIGFASLFFCFPVLKFSLYYPVLTDIPAFTLGIMLVYYFLKKNMTVSFLIIFVGSFIYPTFIIMSLLFLFKSNDSTFSIMDKMKISDTPNYKQVNIIHLLFWLLAPLLLIYIFFALHYMSSLNLIMQGVKFYFVKTLLIWLCIFMTLAYLLFVNYFPKSAFSFKKIFKSINVFGILLALAVYASIQFIIISYTSNEPALFTLESYLFNIIKQVIRNPLNFIIAHIFYFGIAPLLSIFILKDLKKTILDYGYGMVSFFIIVVFFSVGSESRQLINYYPFLVLLLLVTLNKFWNVSLLFSIIYGCICLALSHFWFNINTNLTSSTDFSLFTACYRFPAQRYFMFQGPWVNDYMYKIHLAICIVIFISLWIVLKKTKLIIRKDENLPQNNK